MLPHTYVRSYIGEKGYQFLQKPSIIELSKSVETFIKVIISDMTTSQYWQNLGGIINKTKEKLT